MGIAPHPGEMAAGKPHIPGQAPPGARRCGSARTSSPLPWPTARLRGRHAMSSTASQGAAATAVGVTLAKVVTSRWRWELVGWAAVVETDEPRGALGWEADLGPEPRPQALAAPSRPGVQP